MKVESENLVVIHYHNWSDTTRESRYKMISTHQNPFNQENDYAYVMAISKSSNDTIFKSPSPALTELYISDDEQHIVGISNIKLWNPYQLVIYNRSGNLTFMKHIAEAEAKLDLNAYESFKTRYPNQFNMLDSMSRIEKINEHYFIDFLSMDMPSKLGDAWNYLFEYERPNHLSTAFSETTTNYVYWYKDENPGLQMTTIDYAIQKISLLDPKSKRFEVLIN